MEDAALADELIKRLNNFIESDEGARRLVYEMIEDRKLAGDWAKIHPTVQTTDGGRVGLIGLLNGLVGVRPSRWGYIAAEYGGNGELLCFARCHK